ncbi:enoyl-CoA hydratase domain containing 2 [Homo sapiens]|uniref:Isoform 2 of Enoyl-CoA hydratase domain-containing protein 2, mitochondrial n=2 Tax=Homo sapiens TaxID=9606 RepID=Q86YB7-2|nr:enoyl-CoA hydratase domain-containing protein 2, mitochondrial isoform 2 [Homo sapiens]EAX06763.1 enoyl Coenzyme A hydratase domain containing 2, isoform CRA_a [Homo sapiens]EAX06768.1 enoyl Coenzyme A hydratase domain containing 2, isoform CRA_a [Homo sapiens]KAI2517143.1 enoyl-CoA hydratase domain containing 2 [Homo sapiens]KAI4080697.1 enoyl-CoA hydratase domain containing 2 [Homo sapiens]|eukprot:NP_060751.2 enoyl-CoA hydratase domain-containing protein 2, mitochondrial isoform 2 [Homo sapiens]
MLRVLCLLRPWRPLRARGCASDGAAGGSEIQVRALAGPDQGITEILMNRPSARNALGNVFVSELLETLAQLREDRQVRVLLFRSGVKGVFCAGADLKEREQMSEAEVGVFVQRLRGLMNDIASSAVMGLIETTRGLLPGAGGTQRLPRCLGVALAKELIFTGRRLSGTEAHVLGLVNHAVAQNEEGDAAYQRARALAQEILPQAPIAVRLGKVAIDRGTEVDIASGMAIEGMCYAQNIPTRDRLEGMAAFREKRTPKFVGK